MLRKLGLADAAIGAGSKIRRAEIKSARGRTLSRSEPGEFEHLYGEPTIAIHRADLQRILLSALPADAVRLGARCVRFEQDDASVIAHFANGGRDQADLLIGSDGIHSVVRGHLFPELKLRYAGYTAWRGVVTTKDESALGLTVESWGCGSRFGILRIDENRVYWFATRNMRAGVKHTPVERKNSCSTISRAGIIPLGSYSNRLLLKRSSTLTFTIYRQFRIGERDALFYSATRRTRRRRTWVKEPAWRSKAVWSSPAALTQESMLAEGLRRYQSERMPRTTMITEQSWKIGRLGQLENGFACALRNLLVRLIPSKLMRKALERAVEYEV